jgi:hypothetical protein
MPTFTAIRKISLGVMAPDVAPQTSKNQLHKEGDLRERISAKEMAEIAGVSPSLI